MNKKISFVNKILIIIAVLIALAFTNNFINNVEAISLSEMEKQASGFIEEGEKSTGKIQTEKIVEEFADLGSILTLIGTGVMVAITTYMGIKYLTAGPEAQAKLKTQLVGVLVSGIVIFGAYSIWKIVISVAKNF